MPGRIVCATIMHDLLAIAKFLIFTSLLIVWISGQFGPQFNDTISEPLSIYSENRLNKLWPDMSVFIQLTGYIAHHLQVQVSTYYNVCFCHVSDDSTITAANDRRRWSLGDDRTSCASQQVPSRLSFFITACVRTRQKITHLHITYPYPTNRGGQKPLHIYMLKLTDQKTLNVKQWGALKIWVGRHSPCEFMHDLTSYIADI